MKNIALLIIITGSVLLQGCIYVDRGDGFDRDRQQPTTGQQLLDLDRARAAGAITANEYDRLKQKVIAGDY